MRVLNRRYWPMAVEIKVENKADAERWCYDNFKSADWRDIGYLFYFKKEHDATLFALRWS